MLRNVTRLPSGTIWPASLRTRMRATLCGIDAKLGVGLRGYAVGAAEHIEVVDVGGPEIDAQGLEDGIRAAP